VGARSAAFYNSHPYWTIRPALAPSPWTRPSRPSTLPMHRTPPRRAPRPSTPRVRRSRPGKKAAVRWLLVLIGIGTTVTLLPLPPKARPPGSYLTTPYSLAGDSYCENHEYHDNGLGGGRAGESRLSGIGNDDDSAATFAIIDTFLDFVREKGFDPSDQFSSFRRHSVGHRNDAAPSSSHNKEEDALSVRA
jgi:hypothetical protein